MGMLKGIDGTGQSPVEGPVGTIIYFRYPFKKKTSRSHKTKWDKALMITNINNVGQ